MDENDNWKRLVRAWIEQVPFVERMVMNTVGNIDDHLDLRGHRSSPGQNKANNRLDQGIICPQMATRQECVVCRVTGGTVFLGTGAYMLFSARKNAPGSPRGKKFVMFVGTGMTTTLTTVGLLQMHVQAFYWLD